MHAVWSILACRGGYAILQNILKMPALYRPASARIGRDHGGQRPVGHHSLDTCSWRPEPRSFAHLVGAPPRPREAISDDSVRLRRIRQPDDGLPTRGRDVGSPFVPWPSRIVWIYTFFLAMYCWTSVLRGSLLLSVRICTPASTVRHHLCSHYDVRAKT